MSEPPSIPPGDDDTVLYEDGAPDPGILLADHDTGHAFTSGTTFEHFNLERPLGRAGGQGEVWKAVHVAANGEGEAVALKIYRDVPEADRWRTREQDALGQMRCGMPRFRKASTTATGRHWLAMELIDGHPITSYADKKSLADRLQLVICAAEHLSDAHVVDLRHRDLHAGNILVVPSSETEQPGVWIIDWGLASCIDDRDPADPDRTIAGETAGTPESTAPEVLFRGLNAARPSSDVFALGVVLHQLVTGVGLYDRHRDPSKRDRMGDARAFWADEELHPRPIDRLSRARKGGIDTTKGLGQEDRADWERLLYGQLGRVLLCATHEHPANRYPKMSEFVHDLRAILRAITPGAETGPLVCDRLLPGGNPWIRNTYVQRIINDAALCAGAHALIHKGDLPRARRLLSLVSKRSRNGWEYGYLSALAEPALFVIRGDES